MAQAPPGKAGGGAVGTWDLGGGLAGRRELGVGETGTGKAGRRADGRRDSGGSCQVGVGLGEGGILGFGGLLGCQSGAVLPRTHRLRSGTRFVQTQS